MREAAGHLLGHGRRRPWHLFTLLWIVPVTLALKALLGIVPGAGPQGGEAIVLFLLLAVLGLACCTVVNALRLFASGRHTGILGWIGRTVLAFGGVLFALVTFWIMLEKGTSMVTADGFDRAGWAGALAVLAAMFAFNGWALVRCCARADARTT
jgi:hypothetical protein